jgi:hypothetical protein
MVITDEMRPLGRNADEDTFSAEGRVPVIGIRSAAGEDTHI